MIITNMDRWDTRQYLDMLDCNDDLSQVESRGSKLVYNYNEFVSDIFASMYKFEPKARNQETAPQDEQWADTIYNEISQLQEWRELREHTKLNAESSAAAAARFCHEFMHAVPNTHKKDNQGRPILDPSDIDLSNIRRVAREACGTAAEEADRTNEVIHAFAYGNGTGKPQHTSPTAKREIASRLKNNYQLQRIAELAGRMRRIAAEKQKQKVKHGVDELADITTGDDLARLIPAEIMKLAHPLLKNDFRKKYLEKGLLQYKLRGRERQGRGPLVVCIDESGSMQGNNDVWAKAVGLALLQIAQQQKRKYAMIHFNSYVTRVDHFDKKADAPAIMDAVSHFSGGGTDFMCPLNEAASIIETYKQYKKADIVMITDGSASIDPTWLERFQNMKKELGFHVISVVVSDYSDVCNGFSNKVVHINNITADDEALNIMFSI